MFKVATPAVHVQWFILETLFWSCKSFYTSLSKKRTSRNFNLSVTMYTANSIINLFITINGEIIYVFGSLATQIKNIREEQFFSKHKNSFFFVCSKCVFSLHPKFFSHSKFKSCNLNILMYLRYREVTMSCYKYCGVGLSWFYCILNFFTRILLLWSSTTMTYYNILWVHIIKHNNYEDFLSVFKKIAHDIVEVS